MLSSNYPLPNITAVENSLIGGNVVAVLARGAARVYAKAKAREFALRKAGIVSATKNQNYYNPEVSVVGVPVNVRSQEVYAYDAEVSQHAVESGTYYADHVILRPIRVTLSFGVANYDPGAAWQALAHLETIWENRMPVTLITEHKYLENMVMTSLNATNQLPNWRALDFQASFQHINFITLQQVRFTTPLVTPEAAEDLPVAPKVLETTKGSVDTHADPSKTTARSIYDWAVPQVKSFISGFLK